jgi:hypothetical protein
MFIRSAILGGLCLFLSFFAAPAAAANVCRPYRRTNAYNVCVAYCTTNQCVTKSSRQCRVLRRQFIRRTGAVRLPCDLTAKPTSKPSARPSSKPSVLPSYAPNMSPAYLSMRHFAATSPATSPAASRFYPTAATSQSPTGTSSSG